MKIGIRDVGEAVKSVESENKGGYDVTKSAVCAPGLYIVATPIGNMQDITLRALSVLRGVDIIAAEDTRTTYHLLNYHGIENKKIYHYVDNHSKTTKLIEEIKTGKSVAIVSDAGTPLISDPGSRAVTEAIACGIDVVPVPGASAPIAAICASGIDAKNFIFCGFLESPKNYLKSFQNMEDISDMKFVIFENGRNIGGLLKDARHVLGNCSVVIAREMTKIYEEFVRGDIDSLLSGEQKEKLSFRGEVVVILNVIKRGGKNEKEISGSMMDDIDEMIARGISKKDIAFIVSKFFNIPKNKVYDFLLNMK